MGWAMGKKAEAKGARSRSDIHFGVITAAGRNIGHLSLVSWVDESLTHSPSFLQLGVVRLLAIVFCFWCSMQHSSCSGCKEKMKCLHQAWCISLPNAEAEETHEHQFSGSSHIHYLHSTMCPGGRSRTGEPINIKVKDQGYATVTNRGRGFFPLSDSQRDTPLATLRLS